MAATLLKLHQIETKFSLYNPRTIAKNHLKVAVGRHFPVAAWPILLSLFYNGHFIISWAFLAAKLLKSHIIESKTYICILMAIAKSQFKVASQISKFTPILKLPTASQKLLSNFAFKLLSNVIFSLLPDQFVIPSFKMAIFYLEDYQ